MSKLLIDDSPLQVLPKLAIRVGLNEAIFLQQLHFLTKDKRVGPDGRQWLRKTYPQWKKDTFPFWSTKTIERAAKELAKLHLVIIEQRDKSSRNRDNFYAIDREFFEKWESGEKSSVRFEADRLSVSEGDNLSGSEQDNMTDSSNKDQILIQDQESDHTEGVRTGGKKRPRQPGSFDERNDKSPKFGIEEIRTLPDDWQDKTRAEMRKKYSELNYDDVHEEWCKARMRDGGLGRYKTHTPTLIQFSMDIDIFFGNWQRNHANRNGNGNGYGGGAGKDEYRGPIAEPSEVRKKRESCLTCFGSNTIPGVPGSICKHEAAAIV
jgi:hypothetical protein